MNGYKVKVERGEKVGRELRKPRWEACLASFIPWYDRNTYHYSDFMLTLK